MRVGTANSDWVNMFDELNGCQDVLAQQVDSLPPVIHDRFVYQFDLF